MLISRGPVGALRWERHAVFMDINYLCITSLISDYPKDIIYIF